MADRLAHLQRPVAVRAHLVQQIENMAHSRPSIRARRGSRTMPRQAVTRALEQQHPGAHAARVARRAARQPGWLQLAAYAEQSLAEAESNRAERHLHPGPPGRRLVVGARVRKYDNSGVPPERDLAAFDARALTYEDGWLGRLHHDIAGRAAALALSTCPGARRILDVGCGTGYLLRELARRYPEATELAGVDPAPKMVLGATASGDDARLAFSLGQAEQLPYPDDAFDLVVSTTSFDHWSDQPAGLRECARVLRPGGVLVLVDQFSLLLLPTLLVGRRGKARTRRRCDGLLHAAGFGSLAWHDVYAVLINGVTATT